MHVLFSGLLILKHDQGCTTIYILAYIQQIDILFEF